MSFSTVLIIPAALLTQANALGDALSYGPESYTVPLSSDDWQSVTHWGAHTYATDAFFKMIINAQTGDLPDVDGVEDVFSALIINAPGSPIDPEGDLPGSPSEHFDAVLVKNGLVKA